MKLRWPACADSVRPPTRARPSSFLGVRARGAGLAREAGLGGGGVEHHLRRRRLGAQRAAQRDAVLVAETPVEQHHVGARVAQGSQQLEAVAGGAHAHEARFRTQDRFEPGAQHRMVVNHEDPDHVCMMLA